MAYIRLNKNNFFNNLDIIANQTKSRDKIALVLKDNAYGHGLVEIASMAKEYGITKAVVRCSVEAAMLNEYFNYILVLNDTVTADVDLEKVRYTINSLESISNYPKGTKVELKVNSAMNRNGIEMQELEEAFESIYKEGLILEGVFTHHSSADELDETYNTQKANFQKVKEESTVLAQKYGFEKLRFHEANSAALFRDSNFNDDLARVGIAAYGCLELPFDSFAKNLKPVLSLYAQKISSRSLHKGDTVGYGGSYKALDEEVVSCYDIGYGDGFMRLLSNIYETPKGVKIAGRISMDNSSFLSESNELEIFNDAREVAKYASTISYEVLTSLKPYLKRKVI